MDEEKKKLSVGTEVFLSKIVAGALWIAVGVCGMFRSLICSIVQVILLAASAFLATRLLRMRFEEGDEMYEQHLTRAKACAGDIMHMIYCVASVVATVSLALLDRHGADLSLPRIFAESFFLLMGIQDLLTGLFFRRLEAE